MKKTKFAVIIMLLFCLCFAGCAKVVRTETQTVQATVTSVEYHSAYSTPMVCGKITTFMHHPARHNVEMTYQGATITVDDSELYDEFVDNIGEKIECELTTKYYDDGNVRSYLSWNGR